jgi:UrcA family protein
MVKDQFAFGATCLTIAACFALTGDAARAQDSTGVQEEVTVVAPRTVTREAAHGSQGATRDELISVTYRISYDDLDLSMHADVLELQKRIDETAQEACDLLSKRYPLGEPSTSVCVKQAIEKAKAQANEAVLAANR